MRHLGIWHRTVVWCSVNVNTIQKCLREILTSVYNKHGVWPSKTAQTFHFRIAGNVVMGILRKTVVNAVRCDSDILQ